MTFMDLDDYMHEEKEKRMLGERDVALKREARRKRQQWLENKPARKRNKASRKSRKVNREK